MAEQKISVEEMRASLIKFICGGVNQYTLNKINALPNDPGQLRDIEGFRKDQTDIIKGVDDEKITHLYGFMRTIMFASGYVDMDKGVMTGFSGFYISTMGGVRLLPA